MHQSNFSLSTHASWQDVSWIFSTPSASSTCRRARNIIGDAFFTHLFQFFGAFDSGLFYLNELFLNNKDTLHISRR